MGKETHHSVMGNKEFPIKLIQDFIKNKSDNAWESDTWKTFFPKVYSLQIIVIVIVIDLDQTE